MASQAEPGAAPRVPLSRERVLRAAIDLADTGGIASLTMRKLAQELGVEAMSLYYYVARKDDLLAGIVDLVLGEMELPSAEAGWKAAIRKSAISAHDVLMRHPWACSLMMSTSEVSPARIRWMDSILRCFREAGFSAKLTHHAYHALDSHITGFTLWELSFQFEKEELADIGAAFLRQLPVDEYPYLAEHVEWHLTESNPDDEGEFAFGLDLILDGLERMRDRA
ncbi:MAG: TetR/AcrR family transcriptional regulator [Chloroflexota bacterium]|nr:TetR/AcrR family transcriptional regulator [Chloroflexota bacterium]